MKTTILLSLLFVCIVAGCKNDDSIPAKPIVTSNGSGVIAGKAYVIYPGHSYKYMNQGIEVLLQGTSNSATTDSSGNFTLHNVDSGKYIIRFTKPGPYDTSYAYNVYSNGKDSVYLKEIITDTTWTGVQRTGGTVRELPATLTITNCSVEATESIFVGKDPQDTTKLIRDTSHTWTAEFTIGVNAPNQDLNDRLPVGYMCCLSDKANLDAADLPDTVLFPSVHNKQMGYWGKDVQLTPPAGEQPQRTFSFNKDGKLNTSIKSFEQFLDSHGLFKASGKKFYLHIIPLCYGLVRTKDPQYGTPNVVVMQLIMSKPVACEFVWK